VPSGASFGVAGCEAALAANYLREIAEAEAALVELIPHSPDEAAISRTTGKIPVYDSASYGGLNGTAMGDTTGEADRGPA
jgi:hypothetical protein